ncbi:MAG: HNH endonuclease [Succinivibrio dextrinosolvens]|nr:HNH endonuclease [Succinivibrio dextrinosolvens]
MIKDIINFENYQISDDGRVWSKKSNKWLKPIDVNGYKKASLYKNGKLCQRLIHRLVAEAFIPNPNNYEEINHINEDKSDNRVENLEWCTSSYNINYGTRVERQVNSISKKVFQYSIDNVLLNTYKSCTEAERENPSFNHRGISYACIGKLKTYKGFKWSHNLL